MLTKSPRGDRCAAGDGGPHLAELLVRSTRRLHRCTQPAFGALGLTNAQARAVRLLEDAGRPVRMADLAAALEVVPRTATSVVDDLEEAGLVGRAIDRNDRRSLLVSLTPAGGRLLARLADARRQSADSLFSTLSEHERGELARLLAKVCDGGPHAAGGRA